MSVSALLVESIVESRPLLKNLIGDKPAAPTYMNVEAAPIGRVARSPTPPLGGSKKTPEWAAATTLKKVKAIYKHNIPLLTREIVGSVADNVKEVIDVELDSIDGAKEAIDVELDSIDDVKAKKAHDGNLDTEDSSDDEEDNDEAIRKEFSDFIATDEDDIQDEEARTLEMLMGNGYGTAPIVGRSAQRQSDDFFDEESDVAQASDDPADPLVTLLEIEAVDAATHGKRLANGVFVDDRRGKRAYTRALSFDHDPTQSTDVNAALALVDVLHAHVAAVAATNGEFAMLSRHLKGAMSWRVEASAVPSLRHVIIVYNDRATLDGLPFEHFIELDAAMAEPEFLSKVWRSVNWHVWVRSMFYLQDDVWAVYFTMHEAIEALVDGDNVIYQRLYKSYGECIEFLTGL